MKPRLLLLATVVFSLTAGRGAGADVQAIDESSPDTKAILNVTEQIAQAFNQGDAKAIAGHWSPSGVYLSHETGERIQGRSAIAKDYAAHLQKIKGSVLALTVSAVRLITPDVATVDGSAHVLHPGQTPTDSNFTMVLVKKKGTWLIDSVREVDLPEPKGNSSALKTLDWMVGTWVNQSDGYEVRVVCEWVANKNFLARRFSVARKDEIELEGTQIVGWDANQRALRSWSFDSDGSFNEGAWKQSGNRWLIQANGVLPSGKKASATQIITKADDDKFIWQATNRNIGGVPQPDGEPVTMVREPAAGAASAHRPVIKNKE